MATVPATTAIWQLPVAPGVGGLAPPPAGTAAVGYTAVCIATPAAAIPVCTGAVSRAAVSRAAACRAAVSRAAVSRAAVSRAAVSRAAVSRAAATCEAPSSLGTEAMARAHLLPRSAVSSLWPAWSTRLGPSMHEYGQFQGGHGIFRGVEGSRRVVHRSRPRAGAEQVAGGKQPRPLSGASAQHGRPGNVRPLSLRARCETGTPGGANSTDRRVRHLASAPLLGVPTATAAGHLA